MSRIYEQVGDREGQIGALKQSIVSNPNFPEGHIFLAKAYLDSGAHFDEGIQMAREGLELGPRSRFAPLAHFVLADIYSRQGRAADSAREALIGKSLEATAKGREAREPRGHSTKNVCPQTALPCDACARAVRQVIREEQQPKKNPEASRPPGSPSATGGRYEVGTA